jgi:hypothetical protein
MKDCPKQSKDAHKNDNIDPAETALYLRGAQLRSRGFHSDEKRNISDATKTNNQFRVKVW